MDKPTIVAIRALGMLALIAVVFVPAARHDVADTPKFAAQASADRPDSTPIIVAQGRCYNGRCF